MLARSGEITAPCPVPLSLTVTTPSSMTPALSHLRIKRMMRRSPIRCSTNRMSHSWFTVSKNDWMSASSMKLTFLLWIPTQSASSASCVPRPEPVRDSEEVLLVDRVQQRDHRPLDDLVLQGRDRERALPAVRLRYVDPPQRQCPIRSPLDPVMQVLELALEVRLVVRPHQSIHARRGILLKFVERLFEEVDADVVEKRGEPLPLPFPRDSPYAFQRL